MGSPTGAAGGEKGKECSRGIAHKRCLGRGGGGLQPWDRPQAPQEKGQVECNHGIAHWRSRGRVEGRRADVGRPTGSAMEGRCERGRGRGRGKGGGGPSV